MNQFFKGLTILSFGLVANFASAAPDYLVTHNLTNVESNAYVGNKIPSNHPTKAHSDGRVSWTLVKIACFIFQQNGKCSAMVKMRTDTPNPVELGMVTLDLNTGNITPKTLSAHGYTATVNGPGESTLTQD